MRTGLIVSVIGHAVLLLWGFISLPSPKSLDLSNLEAVPVDFIPIDELTRLNLGVTKAQAREEVVPEPPAPKIAEVLPEPKPEPLPEPLPPEPEVAAPVPEPVPPEPDPLPKPEVAKPEPPPPEQKVAEPEPPPPEPEVAKPEPPPEPAVAPEPTPPPPEEKVAKSEPDVPPPVPRPRPPPPPKKIVVAKAESEKKFNTDEIAALLDKSQPTGSTQKETPPTLGSSTASVTDRMTVNELEALRARLATCWNIQLAPPDPSELRVKVKMFLNRDGSLSRSPEVLEVGSTEFARSAAESAVRAVRRCAPYSLPAQKYDSWREINVTFDPREMFGGG